MALYRGPTDVSNYMSAVGWHGATIGGDVWIECSPPGLLRPQYPKRSKKTSSDVAESTGEDALATSYGRRSSDDGGGKSKLRSEIPPWFGLSIPYADNPRSRQRATQLASYMRERILPQNLDDPTAEAAWTTNFFQHPLVWHTFHWSITIHQDINANTISASITCESLAHRQCAIRLLNTLLSRSPLSRAELEVIIMVVMTLSTNELNEASMAEMFAAAPLPFDPPMPTNDFKTYSRLRRAHVHSRFMVLLALRLGGLEELKSPGLAQSIAICDLAEASRALRPPTFPSLWRPQPSILRALHLPLPGRGFFTLPHPSLTPHLLRLLLNFSSVHATITSHRTAPLSPTTRRAAIETRNALQHALLSLPVWQDLPPADCVEASGSVYTICRLTALLYSNAILFGFPAHTGWHTALARNLHQTLCGLSFETWDPGYDDLALWVLVVGGMAAFRGPDREWYENELRRVWIRNGRPRWSKVEGVLEGFLWDRRGGRHGAAMLWGSL